MHYGMAIDLQLCFGCTECAGLQIEQQPAQQHVVEPRADRRR